MTAPNWSKNYPSGGEHIGPAWQAMWDTLADGEWRDAASLAESGAEAGGCAVKTARNLLSSAGEAGLIDSMECFDEQKRRWCTWYRRQSPAEPLAERIATAIEALEVNRNQTSAIAFRRKAAAVAREIGQTS